MVLLVWLRVIFIRVKYLIWLSGKQISIGDLASLIRAQLGIDFKIVSNEERLRPENSEVDSLLGNANLLIESTTWKPKITLDKGIELTANYVKKNINNYQNDGYIV